MNYVTEYRSDDGAVEVQHLDGVAWWVAPVPPRRHECWAQTRGYEGHFTRVERCACGAIRLDAPSLRHGAAWIERNSRPPEPDGDGVRSRWLRFWRRHNPERQHP